MIYGNLLVGCQTNEQSSVNDAIENTRTSEPKESESFSQDTEIISEEKDIKTLEPLESGSSSQRIAIESEKDAVKVLQENPLTKGDTWTGYYHSNIVEEGESTLDGEFKIVSELTVADYSSPIIRTYTGQYRKGVKYGEFIAKVDGVETETKYTLIFEEDGVCKRGIIYQKGEGEITEKFIEKPELCTFTMLNNTLYGL